MNIGYDVDGVVVEIMKSMGEFLASRGIEVPNYEETHDHNLTHIWRCDAAEVSRRIELFYGSTEFAELSPIEGVVDAFRRLFPPHRAHGITARPERIKSITSDFFARHFRNYGDIHHLGHHGDGTLSGRTKGQVARELGLDLFVEDAPANAQDVASYGIPVLLFSRPWNARFELPQGVTRVNSWEDVLQYVSGVTTK